MRINKQTRTFAKQVQIDLLALSDIDLFQTISLWMDGEPTGSPQDVVEDEDARSALGYTLIAIDPLSYAPVSGSEPGKQWLAPTPTQLRALLTEMDVKLFLHYVLPLAFRLLHPKYPEWGEGLTFNAHLANHLRWIAMNQRGTARGQETPQSHSPAR